MSTCFFWQSDRAHARRRRSPPRDARSSAPSRLLPILGRLSRSPRADGSASSVVSRASPGPAGAVNSSGACEDLAAQLHKRRYNLADSPKGKQDAPVAGGEEEGAQAASPPSSLSSPPCSPDLQPARGRGRDGHAQPQRRRRRSAASPSQPRFKRALETMS